MSWIKITVKSNSKKDDVSKEGDIVIIHTTASPFKGKANRAVIKLLSNYYKKRVWLFAGQKSREKLVEIEE